MACGNNKISRAYLSSQPVPPAAILAQIIFGDGTTKRLSAVDALIAARHVKSAQNQAAGKPVNPLWKVAGGKGDRSKADAREVVKMIENRKLLDDTSVTSPRRVRREKVVQKSDRQGRKRWDHYYEGLDQPDGDGPGHGHWTEYEDGTIKMWRPPFDPVKIRGRYLAGNDWIDDAGRARSEPISTWSATL